MLELQNVSTTLTLNSNKKIDTREENTYTPASQWRFLQFYTVHYFLSGPLFALPLSNKQLVWFIICIGWMKD